jgi:hypothetical protein
MDTHLSNHHHDTIEQIFSQPANSNIAWRQVLSLLEAVGTVEAKHDGTFEVTVGPETETLSPPHGKDVDTQMVVDLRRMLTQGGYAPGGPASIRDHESRDHGDGQWGEPT